jgi:hypothetical protein
VIHDGYTFDGRLTDGAFRFQFRYRPMLSVERRQFLTAFRGWGETALPHVCDWLRAHLLASDIGFPLEDLYRENRLLFAALRSVVVGLNGSDTAAWSAAEEKSDVENLRAGVILDIENPGLSRRSCEDCQRWWYDEDTGRKLLVNGLPVLRPEEAEPACRQKDGCPVGTPEQPRRMSPRNKAAYEHFRLCEAIGQFPDDPIVMRNALVIRQARRAAQREISSGRRPDAGRHDQPRSDVVAATRGAGRRPVAAGAAGIWSPFGDL